MFSYDSDSRFRGKKAASTALATSKSSRLFGTIETIDKAITIAETAIKTYMPSINPSIASTLNRYMPKALPAVLKNIEDKLTKLIKVPASWQSIWDEASREEKQFATDMITKMKSHYLTQSVISALGATHPLIKAFVLMLAGAVTVSATGSAAPAEEKFDIAPFRTGCGEGCQEFYITRNNETVINMAVYFDGNLPASAADQILESPQACYTANQLRPWVQNLTTAAVGDMNQSCIASSLPTGVTNYRDTVLWVDGFLEGANPQVCASFAGELNAIQRCADPKIRAAVDGALGNLPATSSGLSAEKIIGITLLAACGLLLTVLAGVGLYRANRQQQAAQPLPQREEQDGAPPAPRAASPRV